MAEQQEQEVSTEIIISNLEGLDKQLSTGIEASKENINGLFEIIEILKQSDKQKGEQSATKLAEFEAKINGLTGENTTLKNKLKGLKQINDRVENLKDTVNQLINNNAETQTELQKESPSQAGGYQYKSKSKKSRSKRLLKLNRFGLLKSRTKTKKGKKKMKPRKSVKVRKSVKKGGMKSKYSKKTNKKTKKSKKNTTNANNLV
jgi:hypothetical protein